MCHRYRCRDGNVVNIAADKGAAEAESETEGLRQSGGRNRELVIDVSGAGRGGSNVAQGNKSSGVGHVGHDAHLEEGGGAERPERCAETDVDTLALRVNQRRAGEVAIARIVVFSIISRADGDNEQVGRGVAVDAGTGIAAVGVADGAPADAVEMGLVFEVHAVGQRNGFTECGEGGAGGVGVAPFSAM